MSSAGWFRHRWWVVLAVVGGLTAVNAVLVAIFVVLMSLPDIDWIAGPGWSDVVEAGVPLLVSSAGLMVLQVIFLIPVRRPRLTTHRDARRSWSVRVSLAIGGLGATVLAGVGILGTLEFFGWYDRIGDAGWFETGAWVFFALLGLQWVAYSILIIAFVRPAARETMLGRVASMLFLGTWIEVLAIIPIDVMVRRRTSCYCEQGTFFGLMGASGVGIFATGPMIVVALLHRRRKRYRAHMCDACGHDMRGRLGADRCPACGAGWSGRDVYGPLVTCACGHDFSQDIDARVCPACGAGRVPDPLLKAIVRCGQCGYDMRGRVGAERCPECGHGWVQSPPTSGAPGSTTVSPSPSTKDRTASS